MQPALTQGCWEGPKRAQGDMPPRTSTPARISRMGIHAGCKDRSAQGSDPLPGSLHGCRGNISPGFGPLSDEGSCPAWELVGMSKSQGNGRISRSMRSPSSSVRLRPKVQLGDFKAVLRVLLLALLIRKQTFKRAIQEATKLRGLQEGLLRSYSKKPRYAGSFSRTLSTEPRQSTRKEDSAWCFWHFLDPIRGQ
jgi:hypothetical protein